MNTNLLIEQMKFCKALSDRVFRNVNIYVKELNKNGAAVCGWNGMAEAGAGKTQIRAAIVQLRRELNTLSRMLDERKEGEIDA